MTASDPPHDPRRLRALARAALGRKQVTSVYLGLSSGDEDPTPPACRRPGHVPGAGNGWTRLPDGSWLRLVTRPPKGEDEEAEPPRAP